MNTNSYNSSHVKVKTLLMEFLDIHSLEEIQKKSSMIESFTRYYLKKLIYPCLPKNYTILLIYHPILLKPKKFQCPDFLQDQEEKILQLIANYQNKTLSSQLEDEIVNSLLNNNSWLNLLKSIA